MFPLLTELPKPAEAACEEHVNVKSTRAQEETFFGILQP